MATTSALLTSEAISALAEKKRQDILVQMCLQHQQVPRYSMLVGPSQNSTKKRMVCIDEVAGPEQEMSSNNISLTNYSFLQSMSKYQNRFYDPQQKLSEDDKAGWRGESTTQRIREAASVESREELCNRINELEEEVHVWKNKYIDLMYRVEYLNQIYASSSAAVLNAAAHSMGAPSPSPTVRGIHSINVSNSVNSIALDSASLNPLLEAAQSLSELSSSLLAPKPSTESQVHVIKVAKSSVSKNEQENKCVEIDKYSSDDSVKEAKLKPYLAAQRSSKYTLPTRKRGVDTNSASTGNESSTLENKDMEDDIEDDDNDNENDNSISDLNQQVPPMSSKKRYKGLTERDVLLGKGGHSVHHLGNLIYRSMVREAQLVYATLGSKTEKTNLARSIVRRIGQNGGRFMIQCPKTLHWTALSDDSARRKVSQALREKR